jgi:glycosyltransferase involved in cell wall biosynthesis
VNDGSKDATLAVLESYKQRYTEIDFRIFTQENAGAGAARNNGIEKATGDYLVFLDSDDYIDIDYLEQISKKVIREDADVVFIDLIRETSNGELIRREQMSLFQSLDKNRMIRSQLTGKMPWGGVRKVIRTSIIKDNHLRYAPIKVGEESYFSFRVLEEAKHICFQPLAIYHYVDTGTSLTSKDEASNSLTMFNYLYNCLKDDGKLEMYQDTVRAIAITAAAVILNLQSRKKLSRQTIAEAKKDISPLIPYFAGKIDKKSLDSRVKISLPFIKKGWISILMVLLSLKHKLAN